ncbi:MAG: hypothetical protein KGL39_21245 [Patescibacteria group bacterium]|nr:hypothetical protein [Patescibacteria group bacterium]
MAGGPSIPDPNQAAIQGITQDVQNYPFEYLINALSQMGGQATIGGTNYNFTGAGNADVQGQMSDQMAQTILDIQNGLGPQFIAQRLADLKQSDPTGYAARQQLFDKILADANNPAPNAQLSQDTQNAVMGELQKGTGLSPEELKQVQQGVRAGQVSSGTYLGNAPASQEASAVVGAGDQLQQQRQTAAGQFLASGVDPTDIQYRQIQQEMANLGAFLTNTTPTAQFGSLSGAQTGAAPYPNTGYQAPTINEGQAASQGVQNAYGIYSGEYNWANNQINPYIAGLNTAAAGAGTAFNLGYAPWGGVPGGTAAAPALSPDMVQLGYQTPNYNPGQVGP